MNILMSLMIQINFGILNNFNIFRKKIYEFVIFNRSEWGILSLSRNDSYFGTGENYWKGKLKLYYFRKKIF